MSQKADDPEMQLENLTAQFEAQKLRLQLDFMTSLMPDLSEVRGL